MHSEIDRYLIISILHENFHDKKHIGEIYYGDKHSNNSIKLYNKQAHGESLERIFRGGMCSNRIVMYSKGYKHGLTYKYNEFAPFNIGKYVNDDLIWEVNYDSYDHRGIYWKYDGSGPIFANVVA